MGRALRAGLGIWRREWGEFKDTDCGSASAVR